VLTAIIANDVKSFVGVVGHGGFLSTALGTTLRRHHIALVEHLLFLFSEQKNVFTLHTMDLYIRHC
jgi:hypothetical protein